MSPNAIQIWLKKKLAMHAMACWGTALLALLAGTLVLFLTFWLGAHHRRVRKRVELRPPLR